MEKQIRKMSADFSEAELAPQAGELDRSNPTLLKNILSKAAAAGFFSFLVPEDSGGAGLGAREYLAFLEEMAKSSGSVSMVFAAHFLGLAPLLLNCENQNAPTLLANISKMEAKNITPLYSLALKESRDRAPIPATINTSIKISGDKCIVSGEKSGVLCAENAHRIVVIAKNENGKGLAAAAVHASEKGVVIGENRDRLGLGLLPVNDVSFNDVETPAKDVISEGLTDEQLHGFYSFAGAGFGAVLLGMMKAAYDIAVKYSTERYQGGKIICEHDAIKIMLGDMLDAIKITEGLLRGESPGMTAAGFAAEAAEKLCLDAIQTLGGYGYMKDFEVEGILRDVKTLKAIINPAAWKMKYIEDEIREVRD